MSESRDVNGTPLSVRADRTDDSLDTDISELPLLHAKEVEHDPKTPLYRKQYHERGVTENSPLSPVYLSEHLSKTGGLQSSTPSSVNPRKQTSSFLKQSISNRVLNDTPSAPNTSPLATAKVPNSILKKPKNTMSKEVSRKLVDLRPELSSALNEDGELNPLKVTKKLVHSPKKEYFPSRSHHSEARFSSPLTDSIDGKKTRSFISPYVGSSPKKSKKQDSEWEDQEADEKQEIKANNDIKQRKKKSKSWFKFTLKTLVDPQLPYVLSLYLQLLFNVAIVSILLYFIYSFISTVRADVENKVDSYATDILQEIALCSREYLRNNCHPGQRVVALESACSEWEKCMNRDPTTVGRAKIGAETFAEIINGFIKPISWKSMFFLLLITVGSLVLTNAAFGTYRNHAQPLHHDTTSLPAGAPAIPQTPMNTYQTPHQAYAQFTKYYTPRMSPTRHRMKKLR